MCVCVYIVWLTTGLRRYNDDNIDDDDDDDDLFAGLLSDSEKEDTKSQHKPKLKLITSSSKSQLTNSDDGKTTVLCLSV